MSIYIHIPPYDKDRLSPLLTLFWAQIFQQMTLYEPGQSARTIIDIPMLEFDTPVEDGDDESKISEGCLSTG